MSKWLLGMILLTSLLGGCAQISVMESSAQSAAPVDLRAQSITPDLLVASDLVNALMQIEGLHPDNAQLQMLPPENNFGRALQEVLSTVGYKLEMVSSPMGEQLVDYAVTHELESDDSAQKTFQLGVNQIQLKRDYLLVKGRVQPNSNLFARGFDASEINLNDHIFAQAVNVDATTEAVAHKTSEDKLITPQSMDVALEMRVNGQTNPGSYNAGDNLLFTITADQNTHLSCYYRDADRTIMRVFPNRFSSEPMLKAGQTMQLPAGDQWSIEATRSGFSDEVMCIEMGPELQSLTQFIQATPDFEPLPVVSFDELLAEVELATGSVPQAHRMVIDVD